MKKFFLVLAALAFAFNADAQDGFKRTSKGTIYRIVTANPGEKIKLDQIITFNMVQKTEKDSVLASTYAVGRPFQARCAADGDLMDLFPLLAVKDSVIIKVPTDSIFNGKEETRPAFFPKGSNLMVFLKIEKVQSLDEAMAERNKALEEERAVTAKLATQEAGIASTYIADNKLLLKTTPSGLKYTVTQATIKRKPLPGDTVYVHYLGRTLDGKVFDTSIEAEAIKSGTKQDGRAYEPISFALGRGEVIPGWDEGLQLLNEGSKATFIIPSKLAYGERGAGNDIPPYATLRFDVELVKVSPVKHTLAKKTVAKKVAAKTTTVKKAAAPAAKKAVAKKP
ncbi:FKBP-type peptidyl-prolyl cis-trans isomerase [Mucilaginibacter calamicampi]|uniref:peptidylprolyl isomerase n=1 Tax=Mucilaginibacter calamicampi TaxID=1302352 RepID=A0ABW2Z255_9SPHI